MGNINFRPFNDSEQDFQLIADTANDVHGHRYPTTLKSVLYAEKERETEYFYERYVIEKEGQGVGVLYLYQASWNFHPQKYRFDFDVFKAHLSADLLTATWTFIQDKLRHKDIISYCAEWNEYQKEQTAFFLEHGFEVVMRYPSSELSLKDFDAASFDALLHKVKAAGIEIISVTELAKRDADWQRTVYDLENELDQDVPTPEAIVPVNFETYARRLEHNPRWDTDQMFVALDGDKPVGLTRVKLPEAGTQRWGTGMTGVVRSHRRRGIAKALKVVSLRAILDAGGEVIETDNEENNPMYQINMQLGFKPIEAWVDYELAVQK